MKLHLRRATVVARHRYDSQQLLLLLLGIAVTLAGLVAVAMQTARS